MEYPKITVIIPTYNEEKRISKCIKSIKKQDYPIKKVKIIVVDDYSKDKTLTIAKKLGAKVIFNGTHNIEWGKSLGLQYAKSEYVMFIDADNFLITKEWFKLAIEQFKKNEKLVGIQSYKFLYKKHDSLPNRYCALYGFNDPFAFYLGRRGLLNIYEKKWIYPLQLLEDSKNFFTVRFKKNDMPTYGSQGYMTKKSLLLKTNWNPFLFHMDSAYDLVLKNYNIFSFIKFPIEHDYSRNLLNMFKKYKRNIDLYLIQNQMRRYKYQVSRIRFVWVIFIMLTFIIPFYDAFKGYTKKRDFAWFIHPLACFVIIMIYSFAVLRFHFRRFFRVL